MVEEKPSQQKSTLLADKTFKTHNAQLQYTTRTV